MSTPEERKNATPAYIRYSSMAFQLLAALLIGYFAGKFLDGKFNPGGMPYFTAAMMLLFLGLYLFKLIKDITSPK